MFRVASKKGNRLEVCKKGAHSGAPIMKSSVEPLRKERGGPFRPTKPESPARTPVEDYPLRPCLS